MHRKAEMPYQGSPDMPMLALPLSKTEVSARNGKNFSPVLGLIKFMLNHRLNG